MKIKLILCFFVTLSLLQRVYPEQASLPPRGWNSYDSFIWVISEQEFLENAELVAHKLKSHGYEYVVVDYLWYRRKVEGAGTNSLGFDVIDQWGRMVPDPGRWPSSEGGKGFSEVAERVHRLGLKFGIHVMKGISTQAFNANTPILDVTVGRTYEESGRQWHARDIGISSSPCKWMNNGFMSINTTLDAGKAFLRSLYQQYAEWGVDFVKHDCVFGEDDFDLGEISYVSEVLKGLGHPIVYSLSPGVNVSPAMAKNVLGLVNMYRITADDWDTWRDVAAHFDVSRDFAGANMIGAQGLLGKSWPDLDMLPLGWLSSPDTNNGPFRPSNLTPDEQKTQMTLWSMAKSPIMFGGDMRKLDEATYNVITNPTILEIDYFSSNNQEFPYVVASNSLWVRSRGLASQSRSLLYVDIEELAANAPPEGVRAWIATGRREEIYLAFFNLNPFKTLITAKIPDLAKALGREKVATSCSCREAWSEQNLGLVNNSVSIDVEKHGCALFVLNCNY